MLRDPRLVNCAAESEAGWYQLPLPEVHASDGLACETVKPYPAPDLFLPGQESTVIHTLLH